MKKGFEVEGKYKGIYTLFLNEDEIYNVDKIINNTNDVLQIYICINVLDYIKYKNSIDWLLTLGKLITIETKKIYNIETMPLNINIMLNIESENFFKLKDTDQIKFVNSDLDILSISKENMFKTNKNDFLSDIII